VWWLVLRICYVITLQVNQKMPDETRPTGLRPHDHAGCVSRAIDRAEKLSASARIQLTPVRRRTLEILLESHRAKGAYDIAQRLGEDGLGGQPVVAYRALDFLMTHGLVHKIEGLNAFVACALTGETHTPAFMICNTCHKVAEEKAVPPKAVLGAAAKEMGFQINHTIVEAHGICAECAE
jgi:Fur family zinc uptake transcriptional regulator